MLNKNYKKIDIDEIKKRKTYKVKDMNSLDIHFYPAKLNTKMDATYANNLYTSVSDYHDTILKDYFFEFEKETLENIIPEVPVANPISDGQYNKNITITLDYKVFQDIYTKYLNIQPTIKIGEEEYPNPNYPFDLKKVNYFVSDWNAINPHLKYSYWFVDDISLNFNSKTKEISKITFALTLDCYSMFYDYFFFYSGVLNVKRLHNPRWIEDKIYNTGYYVPDFSSQRFIRNCDRYCSQFNEQIQRTQTVPLVSSRHWNVEYEEPKNVSTNGANGEVFFWKWNSDKWDAQVEIKKPVIFLLCMRINQYQASVDPTIVGKKNEDTDGFNKDHLYSYFQGEITNIDGYSEPFRYFAYIPSDPNGVPKQSELAAIINTINVDGIKTDESDTVKEQQYRVVNSIYTENIFDLSNWDDLSNIQSAIDNKVQPGTFWKIKNGELKYYRTPKVSNTTTGNNEYFYFIEPSAFSYTKDREGNDVLDQSKQQPYLWKKMFKTRDEIISVKTITEENYDIEPHLFTNQHFTTSLGIFNKNPLTFDISTLLINNNGGFERAEVVQKQGGHYFSYKLMVREGTVSSDSLNIKYFLLDQDTSVAYKRDNNLLTISVSGTYIWPYYDNTWNEFIHNNQNQRQTALDNIQQQYKVSKSNAWLNFGGNLLGGALSGAASGANIGRLAGKTGASLIAPGGLSAISGTAGAAFGDIFGTVSRLRELKAQRDMATNSINAQYNDAKNQPANYNVGSAITTQTDMLFSRTLNDDIDQFNYNFLWTPKITFTQLKDYDCRTVAEYLNKMGYPQDQFIRINESLNEIAYREYWNRWQFTNADEFFKKDSIPPVYWFDVASALMEENGACFFNADVISWEDIYNWDIHNVEKTFDTDLMVLEGEIYG